MSITSKVIAFTEVMQAYGIEQTSQCYTYHRENGAEVLDIDFRLELNDNNDLVCTINKSYDKDTVTGGHYTQDTTAEVDIKALESWLEDNKIYSRQAHSIANKLFNTVLCITLWEAMENEFYREVYTEYQKCSCETATAIQILLEKLPDLTDRYYVQKVWLNIQLNEEGINKLF